MRVLAVTNQFPLPLDSGEPLRVDGLLRALAAEHDVHLLALARPTTTPELVAQMAERLGRRSRSRSSSRRRPAGLLSAGVVR